VQARWKAGWWAVVAGKLLLASLNSGRLAEKLTKLAGNLNWFENSGLPCWVKDYVNVLY